METSRGNKHQLWILPNRTRLFRTIRLVLFFILGAAWLSSFSQSENKLLREGNKLFDQEKYKEAELKYRKAIEKNNESVKGQYNLGAAAYKQKNYDEAAKLFSSLSESKTDKNIQPNAFHNLGNSLLESKKYDESIKAYENSLLKNPSDKDTKYNLEYAKRMLKKQQQQNKDNKDKKDEDKKDKDKKDKDKQNQNKDQNQSKNQQDQNKKISKEDAERMLEALKNDEKKTLSKLNKDKVRTHQQVVIEKDW
jgi:Ca-activated chloride channel homolog